MRLPKIATAARAGTLLGAIVAATMGGVAAVPTPADAQTQATTPAKAGCNAGAVSGPATPKDQDTAGGTAPGNTGNNGFTGAGISGSWTGTSQNGPVAGSPSVQPATAKGLDPITAPPRASDTGKC